MLAQDTVNREFIVLMNNVNANVEWRFNVSNLDKLNFRVGYSSLTWLCPLALSDVALGSVILSPDDFKRVVKEKGVKFAQSFSKFVVAHELGHLQQWRLGTFPKQTQGLVQDEHLEQEADSYARLATRCSTEEYREYMVYIHDGVSAKWTAEKGYAIDTHAVHKIREARYKGSNVDIPAWKNGVPDLRRQLEKLTQGLF